MGNVTNVTAKPVDAKQVLETVAKAALLGPPIVKTLGLYGLKDTEIGEALTNRVKTNIQNIKEDPKVLLKNFGVFGLINKMKGATQK